MPKPTIKTIAKEAGVSVATVSKALNDMPDVSQAVKERIRAIATAQGYTINAAARSLASGQTYSVGLVVPDIAQPGFGQVFNGVFNQLDRAGYALYAGNSGFTLQKEARQALEMVQKQVGAVIMVPCTTELAHVEESVQGRVPVIYLAGAAGPGMQYAVVGGDIQGGRLAARHLWRCGHRHCRVMTQFGPNTVLHQRLRGFVEYMQGHGATVDVREAPAGLDSAEAGALLAKRMLEKNRQHTAIFATDDQLAFGAMGVFVASGKAVPGDISVVGYGDAPSAQLDLVRLTTVRPPWYEMGICAGDMAMGILRGDAVINGYTLEPQLIKRATVKNIV